MTGESQHLHQITERGFAAVTLPVGICGEAHGGVERQVRSHRRSVGGGVRGTESRGVQWKKTLQALQRVEKHGAENTESQHATGVLRPALFHIFSDAAKFV